MRRISSGWEGSVQDEKDQFRMRRLSTVYEKYEYRMRRISIQYKKDQYMMRKIRYYTGWEGSDILQDEKDQYRMRKIRYYTGWEGWEGSDILQDEKDQMFYRMRRISTIWEGWVQYENCMSTGWEGSAYRMWRISSHTSIDLLELWGGCSDLLKMRKIIEDK